MQDYKEENIPIAQDLAKALGADEKEIEKVESMEEEEEMMK